MWITPGSSAVPPGEGHFRAFEGRKREAAKAVRWVKSESYYVIPADFIRRELRVQRAAPQLLADADEPVKRLVRENLLRTLPDPNLAARLADPLKLTRRGPPPAQFSLIPAEVDMRQLTTAGLVVALFAYLLNISGSLLVRALQRETQARVLEVLIASTRPAQFIGGKIMGLAALSLGQATLTLLAGALVYGHNPDGSGPAALPLASLALSLPYLLFGYIAYCGLIMAVAVIWPNLPESLSLLTIIRLLALSPALGIIFILPQPDGAFAVALSLCPLTSPLLMPFRLLLVAVPLWQWVAGVLVLAALAGLAVWVSIRLFAAQGLLTGRALSPRVIWAVLRG
ncbi:MAG: ABC transporter permease [Anaerolineae bacterium]